jgi:hypothetical protein
VPITPLLKSQGRVRGPPTFVDQLVAGRAQPQGVARVSALDWRHRRVVPGRTRVVAEDMGHFTDAGSHVGIGCRHLRSHEEPIAVRVRAHVASSCCDQRFGRCAEFSWSHESPFEHGAPSGGNRLESIVPGCMWRRTTTDPDPDLTGTTVSACRQCLVEVYRDCLIPLQLCCTANEVRSGQQSGGG